jgi:glycosyltransferase involved in cell wall biosynthesis/GT2 family glycosyltransferase
VFEYPNIGGDIAPFMELLTSLLSYDLVCKIHTKRDVPPTGAVWREYLLQSLLGSTETVNKIIEVFSKDKELNILGTSPFYKAAHKNTIPETWFFIKQISQAMGIEKQLQKNWGYFAGTMFWIRPRCLLNMARYFCENPIYSGEYKVDGLPEHAIERLICLSAVDAPSSRVGLVELSADGHAGIVSVLPHERQNKEPVTATLENLAKSSFGGILNGGTLKKRKEIGEVQTNGVVSVTSVVENNHQLSPRKRIMYFFPDYRVNNAYQLLLYQSNFKDYEIVPGTIDDCLKRLLTDCSSELYDCVYHLHWLHPLVTPARNVEEAQIRVNNFIDKLHLFIALGGRIIWTIHNVVSHEPKYIEEEIRLSKAVAELSHWIHVHHACVVEATRPYYELPLEKVVIAEHGNYIGTLPCTVDRSQARQELEIPEKATVFLFLGQIRSYKGIDDLLDAYARIISRKRDCWLVVAGKLLGIDQGDFEKKVASLPGTLFHPGYVADDRMQIYLKSADVMVLPYKKVLTSGSVFLAMSFGLPVICPEAGLLSHIVRDGENGVMYKADDSEGLYSSMNRFLNETVHRKTEMGERALGTAESYCWEDTSRKLRLHIEGAGFGRAIRTNLGGMQRRWFLSRDLRCLVNKRCIAVILHYNNIEDTQNCVEAVSKQGQDIGVVLVSNNESIVDAFQLANLFPQVLVVQSEDNIGYAAANNFGLWVCRQLQPEFFWLLNPDILVPRDYYQDLVQRTEKWQNHDYFASTIVHALQPDKVLFCGGEVSIDEGARPGHLHMGANVSDLPKEPFTCDYLTGANVFGRSRVLEKAGYLPEQYFLYFEETEWFLSQNLEEFQKPLIFPDMIVRNYKRSEEGNLPARHYLYYFIRNSLLFGQKYASSNMELCIGETRKFAQAWLNKIAVHAPQKLGEFEPLIDRAFKDGRMGRTGRVVI